MAAPEMLVVEDNPNDIELMQHALERLPLALRATYLRDGSAATSYFEPRFAADGPPLPRLVFLDLKLPCVSGLDILKRLRQEPRTKTLPVVMLTSSQQESDIQACYRAGANSYLVKPVDFVKFSKSIEACAAYWLAMGPPP